MPARGRRDAAVDNSLRSDDGIPEDGMASVRMRKEALEALETLEDKEA